MGHMVKYPDRRDGSTLFDFYGNIIPASGVGLVFTAKGDIPVGTGPGTGVMQAVGTDGQVLTADSTQTDGVKWATPGTGAVSSVTAGDASLVISPTTGAIVAETGTLDQIANLHPAAANWSNNAKKITGLANGTAAQDAAAFGQIPVIVGSGLGVYGDGSDGAQTFDGTSTITLGPGPPGGLTIVPSAMVYTLARDIWLTNATINSGVTVNTNGFRLFCQGTLTNNGTILSNGGNGGNGTTVGGTAGSGLYATNNGSIAQTGFSSAGGVGATGTGNTGGNQSVALGGVGGQGGTGTSPGGAGGTQSLPGTTSSLPRFSPFALYGGNLWKANGTFTAVQGGSGGGGGGGDATNAGGGGGGGGGTVGVFAKLIAGTGAIQARGGNGGNGNTVGNTGGGGGGGGGVVLIVSASVISAAIAGQTIDTNGGSGGAGHGTGATGSTGNPGFVSLVPN